MFSVLTINADLKQVIFAEIYKPKKPKKEYKKKYKGIKNLGTMV